MQADPELADHITTAGILPYFALSWYITWFAHDVSALPQVARLFDLFMASHPLMPLYVGAVAMKVRLRADVPALMARLLIDPLLCVDVQAFACTVSAHHEGFALGGCH